MISTDREWLHRVNSGRSGLMSQWLGSADSGPSWRNDRRALWAVPSSFVNMMVAGSAAGMACIELPFVEIGIGQSVVILGAAVAFSLHLPTVVAMALLGVFAIFHGHAHGAEMPETASGFEYTLGFVLATAGLRGYGIGLGLVPGRMGEAIGGRVSRVAGCAMAPAGPCHFSAELSNSAPDTPPVQSDHVLEKARHGQRQSNRCHHRILAFRNSDGSSGRRVNRAMRIAPLK